MKRKNNDILLDIYQRIVKLETKLDDVCRQNDIDHKEIKDKLTLLKNKVNDEITKMDKRVENLEHRSLSMSAQWKLILFLMTLIPWIFEILRYMKIIP